MATNPLHKLQDAVVGTVKDAVKDPVGTAGKAVTQARETVAVGRTVAGHVVGGVLGGVASRAGRGRPEDAAGSPTEAPAVPDAPAQAPEETARAAVKKAAGSKKAAATTTAKATAKSARKPASGTRPRVTKPPVTDVATESVVEQAQHRPVPEASGGPENPIDAAADPAAVEATPTDLAARTSAAAPAAKKAPARKAARKTAQNTAQGTARPAAKRTTKKTVQKSTQKSASARPSTTVKKAAAAETSAPTAAETPAKRSAPRKSTARKVANPRKAATPSGSLPVPGSAAGKDPLGAEELAAGAGPETITPAGTRGVDVGHNPDTGERDLQQPGTPPVLDEGTAKSVRSESETMSRAARTKKS